jgi:hypothetical protein
MIRYLTFHEGILNWWCIGYVEQVGALFYVGVINVGDKYHHMTVDRNLPRLWVVSRGQLITNFNLWKTNRK